MADAASLIWVPKRSRRTKPRAILYIEAGEGGRLDINMEFDPPVPGPLDLHHNPAAETLVTILRAAQMKGVISKFTLGSARGGLNGARVNQGIIPTDEDLG